MKKLMFSCLILLSVAITVSFVSNDFSNYQEDKINEITSDGCWKVHFDCDGKKFTKYVKGTSVGDAKSRAKKMHPNCKIGTMTSYSKDRCSE